MEGLQATVIHYLVNIIIELRLAYQTVLPDSLTDDLPYREPW